MWGQPEARAHWMPLASAFTWKRPPSRQGLGEIVPEAPAEDRGKAVGTPAPL